MQCDPSPGRRVACNSRQRVPGSVRVLRAVRNTRVFLTEIRVIADVDVVYLDSLHRYTIMINDMF